MKIERSGETLIIFGTYYGSRRMLLIFYLENKSEISIWYLTFAILNLDQIGLYRGRLPLYQIWKSKSLYENKT